MKRLISSALFAIFLLLTPFAAHAAPLYDFEPNGKFTLRPPDQQRMTEAESNSFQKSIDDFLKDHHFEIHARIYGPGYYKEFPNDFVLSAPVSLARKIRDLLKARGIVLSGDFDAPKPLPIREAIAERIKTYQDASRAMTDLIFKNVTGMGLTLTPEGEILPAPLFGESKKPRLSAFELREHYKREEERLRKIGWPRGQEELNNLSTMNLTEHLAYERATNEFHHFFNAFTDAYAGMSDDGIKQRVSKSAEYIRALRAISRRGLSDRLIKDEQTRNSIKEDAQEAGQLSKEAAGAKVNTAVADAVLVSAAAVFKHAKYSPLYSDLTAALCEKSIDKAIELVGHGNNTQLIQKAFVGFAFDDLATNPEGIGYFTQKLLHRISSDNLLEPLIRAVAGAMLLREVRLGHTMHVKAPKAEKMAELYSKIFEASSIIAKIPSHGGSRKQVHFFYGDKDSTSIDEQIQMLDEEIKALGMKTNDWDRLPEALELPASRTEIAHSAPAKVIAFEKIPKEKADADPRFTPLLPEDCGKILFLIDGARPPKK